MRKEWWRRLWSGPLLARFLVGVAVLGALFALAVSGSLSQLVVAVVSGASRGSADELPWEILWLVFLSDITGTPGLFVSATKTVFAVGIAFVAVWGVRSLRGEISLELPGLKLSGTQSGVFVWCAAFALVKLL